MNDGDRFTEFFLKATKHSPFDYQRRLACGERNGRSEKEWLQRGSVQNDSFPTIR